nr:hypothetical protein [Streptomyces sp. 846.5]
MRRLLDDRNDVPGFLAAWYGPPDRPTQRRRRQSRAPRAAPQPTG